MRINTMSPEIVVDCIGLEPPEPLERVLEAISIAEPDQVVRMLIDREPVPLYRILGANGYAHETQCRDDGSYEIRIWRRR
jgi:TusA-related sulfurtransferase